MFVCIISVEDVVRDLVVNGRCDEVVPFTNGSAESPIGRERLAILEQKEVDRLGLILQYGIHVDFTGPYLFKGFVKLSFGFHFLGSSLAFQWALAVLAMGEMGAINLTRAEGDEFFAIGADQDVGLTELPEFWLSASPVFGKAGDVNAGVFLKTGEHGAVAS